MSLTMDDSRPIFVQIAERIEDDIIEARMPEESQVPSTNQFAAFIKLIRRPRRKVLTCWWTKAFCIKTWDWHVCSGGSANEADGEEKRIIL